MTDASSLRSLRCPNCGAPVQFPPGQTSVRCSFCDSVIEHSAEALTADDHAHVVPGGTAGSSPAGGSPGQARRFVIKTRNGQPVVIEMGDQPGSAAPTIEQMYQGSRSIPAPAPVPNLSRAQPARRSSGAGCWLGLFIVVVTVVPICLGFTASVPGAGSIFQALLSGNIQQALGDLSTLGTNIQVGSSGTILPGANDGPPEAIMLTNQYPATRSSTSEHRLVAVSTTTGKLLWQSAQLDANLYSAPILANNTLVFTVSGHLLVAIRRTDGSTAWQATLADKVTCLECVRLAGPLVGVLSDDGTLEVYDTATGQSQWMVSAKQDQPHGLYLLGQRLAFMDRDANDHGVLRTFDPATGQETTAQPDCRGTDNYDNYADWTTPLFVSADGADFYLAPFGGSTSCVQRWDAQSIKLVWSTVLTQSISAINSPQPLFSADSVYLAAGQSVLGYALDQGTPRTVVDDANYAFNMLAVHGGDVILSAQTQRGTTRYAIWSVDGTSGANHWKFDLGENPPLDYGGIVDDNKPEWFVQPATDGLRVLRVQSAADNKSHALLHETLNWQTGKTSGQLSTQLGLPTLILTAPDWIFWKNDTLWMGMEQELVAFDAAQNKMIFRWP